MGRELFDTIIDQLAEIQFTGRLSFHFFNEPLLRRDLEALVTVARSKLPLAYFVLYTNGDLLTDERYAELLSAGMDHFFVTRHDFDAYPTRPFQHVQHPHHFTVSGRGGTIAASTAPLDIACFAPSEMLIITVEGDVVLCHEDAEKQHIMGSFANQTLAEIWFGERFKTFRIPLEDGERFRADTICQRCDNRLYPVPGTAI
jgi:GTP 3',8-cyclase